MNKILEKVCKYYKTTGLRISRAVLEADRRVKARRYIAASWLPSIKSFGRGKKTVKIKPVKTRRGQVIISGDPSSNNYSIELVNSADGASIVNAKHNHVGEALSVVTADMAAKIKERMERTIDGRIKLLFR